ncbi:MAG: response regulator transcription factor [Cytophagales bacterium]
MMDISVAIIEDQSEIRESLATLLKGSFGFSLTGAYENAEDAMAYLPANQPQIALVDIHLPGKSGIFAVGKLKNLCPNTQFMMCTAFDDNENIFNALKAGASGYLLKTTPAAKILDAISDLAQGGSPMSAQIARKVVASFNGTDSVNKELEKLSAREQEILGFLSKGFRYKEIADKLFVSIETVRTHISNIYQKLQVNSRTDALNKVFGEK